MYFPVFADALPLLCLLKIWLIFLSSSVSIISFHGTIIDKIKLRYGMIIIHENCVL